MIAKNLDSTTSLSLSGRTGSISLKCAISSQNAPKSAGDQQQQKVPRCFLPRRSDQAGMNSQKKSQMCSLSAVMNKSS